MRKFLLPVCLLMLTAITSFGQTPLSANGRLRLVGNQLSNECGNAVQLRGMSTHNIAAHQNCYTRESVKSLAQDWSSDLIRLAVYTEESNGTPGYTGADKTFWNAWIDEMVLAAEEFGMYVIIDWHILYDGNPLNRVNEAKEFFTLMSQRYKGKKHVIYEICNEPNGGTSWSMIKDYAQQVIPVIRTNDPNGIILVGTPEWSSQITHAADSPLSSTYNHNVMYTFHFYAGTHTNNDYTGRLKNAAGRIPVFVSEWGTPNADGSGGANATNTATWTGIMDGNNDGGVKISSANWSFVDKNEGASALTANSCAFRNWTSRSPSGDILYNYMRGTTFTTICSSAADDDKDGVPNGSDNCANTPFGVTVNAQGCPDTGDADNDGVVNWQDLCAGTASGAEVDLNGCPIIDAFVSNVCQGFNNYQGYARSDFTVDSLANFEYWNRPREDNTVYSATTSNQELVIQTTNADPGFITQGFSFGVDADSNAITLDIRRHPVVKMDVNFQSGSYPESDVFFDVQLEDVNGNVVSTDAMGVLYRIRVPLNQWKTYEIDFTDGYRQSYATADCGTNPLPCYVRQFDFSKVAKVLMWVNPGAGETWSKANAFTGTWKIDNFSIGYDNATTCTAIRDDDGDGVKEEDDLCKNTPQGEVVDAFGCAEAQADDDNDGVVNDLDLCPSTPAGASVDANGCAQSQLDDDNDGVVNSSDLCANTASGETVNTNGCSDTQLNADDDNDGVRNADDLCPNTASGATVNTSGCSFAQQDNDGDGSPNGEDECDNDPLKTLAGNCGCGTPETDCTVDCAGVRDGFAYTDECGQCVGGTTGTVACTGTPYENQFQTIPGIVQAERFDTGGEGVGYHDNEATNQGGAFRTGEGVDLENCEGSTSNFNVAYTALGEWLEYSIESVHTGLYTIDFRVASATTTGGFNLELDGQPLMATMSGVNTGGWQTYQIVSTTEPVTINKGKHVLRLNITAGDFNLDYMDFKIQTITGSSPAPATNIASVYPVPATDKVVISQKVMDYNKAVIMDITGSVVKTADLTKTQQELSIESLPQGIYLIQLTGSGKSEMLRIVVQ